MNGILSFLNRVAAVLILVGLVLAGYLLMARPYQMRWGATDAEVARPMPGDELATDPTFLATRAITIDGPAEAVWPWLVQMGFGRAGFYGYDILENMGSPSGPRSADRIIPELQQVKVGDEVPISVVSRMVLYALEPNRYLIWSGTTGVGGFTWALYPIDADHTRLVSRIRWSHHWSPPDVLALDLLTEFTDHLAVRKILQGIQTLVEGRRESIIHQNVEFAVYVAALLIFFAALVLTLWHRLTWPRWLAALAAGSGWLVTWYAPVPIWLGAGLELLVLWALRGAFRKTRPAG